MLLRNPMHAMVLLRDWIRFRCRVHRHIVALSEANKREVVRLYGVDPGSIAVIPNGVDLDRFKPDAAARAAVRRELSWPSDVLVGVFVGHEFERKGLDVALAAIRGLSHSGPDVRLIVAGGDAAAGLREAFGDVAAHVAFVGHRSDVERYYAAADVFDEFVARRKPGCGIDRRHGRRHFERARRLAIQQLRQRMILHTVVPVSAIAPPLLRSIEGRVGPFDRFDDRLT